MSAIRWLGGGIYKKPHKRSGVEFYYVRFLLKDGKRKVERAGTTLDQAKRLLKKRFGEVASGTYVDPRKKPGGDFLFGGSMTLRPNPWPRRIEIAAFYVAAVVAGICVAGIFMAGANQLVDWAMGR